MFSLVQLECEGPKSPLGAPGGSPGGHAAALWGALGGPCDGLGWPRGLLREHFWKTGGIATSLVLWYKVIQFWLSEGLLGKLEGSKDTAMSDRSRETGPEGP